MLIEDWMSREILVAVILFGVLIVLVLAGITVIPSSHIGVLTAFGRRTRRVVREGWRWCLPGCKYVLVEIQRRNEDLPSVRVRTRDHVEVEIGMSLAWAPSEQHALEYLNHDSDDAIRTALRDIVAQKLREWAAARAWNEAVADTEDLLAFLVKELGEPGSIEVQRERQVRRLAMGDGRLVMRPLGVQLNRLSIREIRLVGDLGTEAEAFAGMKLVRELAAECGLTPKEIIEILQVKQGRVVKQISELRADVSPEALEGLRAIVRELLGKEREQHRGGG
jgi:regulator of protease activity HflC (stomatin/prohibitin superfamily)